MKKIALAAVLACSIHANDLADNSSSFIDGATISIGESRDGIKIYRMGLRKDFSSKWVQSSFGYLSGYWEGSLNYWKGKSGDKNYGVAVSPVFAYYIDLGEFKPFIEAGIGASIFNKTQIDNRNMSTNFLFEDRIGVGFRYKNFDFSFRYMHYSNASIKAPNDGIDIWIGSISYKF